MGYRWLDDLDQALAAGGVAYVEVGYSDADPTGAADWRTRGRPHSTGQFDPGGVLCHHTASGAGTSDQSDLNVILYGNGSAPGPISQLYIGRGADVYLVAAGRANHGGSGTIGHGCQDMNAALVGIEVGNNGTGEWWPDAQVDAYAATVRALCSWYGWDLWGDVWTHSVTGPPCGNYKIDPAGPCSWWPQGGTWDLDAWRGYLAADTAPPTPQPPQPIGDDTMPAYITVGSLATFAMTGGMCHWIADPGDADRLGVPPPDQYGARGTWVTPQFMKGLILVGPMPNEPDWNEGWFADWWPEGHPR